MMANLFLSRVLGVIRNGVIAGMFGQSILTSAYRQSFIIPDLLFFLIAGGALSSAFIPVFSEYLHTDREDEAWKIFSVVVTAMTCFITLFIVFAWLFSYQLIQLMVPGSPETWAVASSLSKIVLPAQLAFFIGGLMFGTLYSKQIFTIPGLGPNLYNIGIILGAVVISHFVNPSVAGMSWGALIGAFVGNIFIPIFAMKNVGAKFSPSFDLKHPGVVKVFKLMLPVLLGLSLPAVFGIVMQYFGSYYGEKMPTALDNCDRIMQAPLAIFGQSFAIAAFPALSQFFTQGRMDSYRDQLIKSLKTVIFLSLPVSALLIAMPEGVIKILLEHGKFSALDTEINRPILQFFAIGIGAWCLHPMLMRAYFSIQQTLRPILLSTSCTALFVVLCLIFQSTPLKHLGLPLAGSVSAIVLAIILLIGIKPLAGDLDIKGLLKTLLQCSLAAIALGLVCYWGLQVLMGFHLGKIYLMIGIVVLGLIGAQVYLLIAKAMKMPEYALVTRALNRKKQSDPQPPPVDDQG